MNFGQAIATCFRKYADFSGVAARPEFWWWTLFTVLVSIVVNAIDNAANTNVINTLVSLAILLPGLAVAVRRLRDAGHHWAWLFIALVPVIGWIVLIVFYCQPGVSATRRV